MTYDRNKSVEYAHKWAYDRNPAYYDFSQTGGDCTSFVSQCLYAGCGIMNYTYNTGWYYNSPNNRAAAWSGVEYLYQFLTANKDIGPYGTELPLEYSQIGDIIQLSFNGLVFHHSLFVVNTHPEILIASHSDDWDNRSLNTYIYQYARLIHVEGVRA